MNQDRIVFAMANPDPEIDPKIGDELSRIFATGRSDYPNQINNAPRFREFSAGPSMSRPVRSTSR